MAVLAATVALCCGAESFKSGKFYYEVVGGNQVQIVAGPSAYSNITTSDFVTTVTNGGTEYTVVGVGIGAFKSATTTSLCKLPEGYLYIDSCAFAGAIGASGGIRVPASMVYVAPDAFEGNRLGFITAAAASETYASLSTTQDGATYYFLCNKEQTKIIAAPGEKLKTISGGVEYYVSSIVIPSQITEIGEYAFSGNLNLKSLTLHNGITKYGKAAFYGCKNLTSVNLPNPDAEYGTMLFCDCSALSRVTLPTGIKSLPGHMFFCCTSLTSINLPEGLKEMHIMCLSSTGLTSVNLPSTLELLDTCALQNTGISAIDLKNVKVIGNQCFSSCANLKTITGGSQVEEIQNAAFTGCNLITAAPYFPSLKRIIGSPYFRLPNLVDFTVPASTEYIQRNPVSCCPSLKEIKVEEGCANFAACDSCLYELKDGKPYRLLACPGGRLNTVLVLRPGTVEMAEQAIREVPLTGLYGNAELREIGVTGTKFSAALATVQMLASVPPTGGTMFADETYANVPLYVPRGSVEAYQTAEGWCKFQNIIGIDVEEPFLRGDANGDGQLDPADISALIDHILNGSYVTPGADVDENGEIDPADISALIDLLLNAN